MRWGLRIFVVLSVLWCVWWGVAVFGLTSGVNSWFETQAREGVRASVSKVSPGGFPMRVEARLGAIDLGPEGTEDGVRLDGLVLSARTLWPGDMQVQFPQTPIRLTGPAGASTLIAETARADLNLRPGTALELEQMSLTSAAFRLEDETNSALLGGEAFVARAAQTATPQLYDLTFDVTNFTPGAGLRDLLELPDGWPLIFEQFKARANVAFDRPLGRADLEPAQPPAQPQMIDLSLAELQWGDMRLSASGSVVRDASGDAEGSLVIKAENWTRMLDIAVAGGILPPDFRPQAEGMLRGLARGTGRTDDLDVTLTFGNGLTRIGFLPIGPAPSMIIR